MVIETVVTKCRSHSHRQAYYYCTVSRVRFASLLMSSALDIAGFIPDGTSTKMGFRYCPPSQSEMDHDHTHSGAAIDDQNKCSPTQILAHGRTESVERLSYWICWRVIAHADSFSSWILLTGTCFFASFGRSLLIFLCCFLKSKRLAIDI
jgi:hypothetical protein